MDLDENDVTLASYDAAMDAYLAASLGQPCRPLLDVLRAAAPPPARVLEIGSGQGFDAAQLRADGYDVQATDASASFLNHLRGTGRPWGGSNAPAGRSTEWSRGRVATTPG